MSAPECGCVYSETERRFTKYCREHALMILRKRAEKAGFPCGKPVQPPRVAK